MSTSGPPAEALSFVLEQGSLEGALSRPFADRRATLATAQADDATLGLRRARLVELLTGSDGTALREAFGRAFDRARTTASEPPTTPLQDEAAAHPPQLDVAPPAHRPVPPSLATPSFMQVAPPAAVRSPLSPVVPAPVVPAPVAPLVPPAVLAPSPPAPDETAFLRFVPAEPTLPFVPGDAKAFVAAALAAREETTTDAVAMGDEATTAASGDETQALDLRKLLGEVHPFEREVERSLAAFVDFLVELTRGSGREDEIGARFGVPTTAEREQVLAAWRKRWDAEPAVRAEWQRLYADRARR